MSDEAYEALERAKEQIIFLDSELTRLMAAPLAYATVVKADNAFKLDNFAKDDRMIVIDKNIRGPGRFYGKIASDPAVDSDGNVVVEFPTGKRERLNIGLDGKLPQVKLVGKDDGMNVVINLHGQLFEVHGLPTQHFHPPDMVKVDMETKQIHDHAGVRMGGDVCFVKEILDGGMVEVEKDGQSRVVINAVLGEKPLEAQDRVVLDTSSTMIIRYLQRAGNDLYSLKEEITTTFEDIAGLEDVKEQIMEAVAYPFKHPEIYKAYGMRQPKGMLLSGPPGCGKTLAAKAMANLLAQIIGKDAMKSGFIYIRGPEIQSHLVSVAEHRLLELFVRAEEHYKRCGYPALLFIDEADALFPIRGSLKSSDVERTMVPTFLSAMDGLKEARVMVVLASNQPKTIDPAVVREGRCDRHLHVGRPTQRNAPEYFKVHLRGLPLEDGLDAQEVAGVGTAELFSTSRVLYKVSTKQHGDFQFRLGDAISGAMIAGVAEKARARAMRRDRESGVVKGVSMSDFRYSVEDTFRAHHTMPHSFDLEDFLDNKGIPRCEASVSKVPLAIHD